MTKVFLYKSDCKWLMIKSSLFHHVDNGTIAQDWRATGLMIFSQKMLIR